MVRAFRMCFQPLRKGDVDGTDGADAVGEVFAVGVADRQYRDAVGAVVTGVGDRGRGERVTRLIDRVVASTTTSRSAARWAGAAACSAVVLPNPAGAANTRTDAPSPHSTRTASAWSTPSDLGVTAIACSTSASSMELPGIAINWRNVPRTWSSTARCSTVDHSAGRRRWSVGHQPHDQS